MVSGKPQQTPCCVGQRACRAAPSLTVNRVGCTLHRRLLCTRTVAAAATHAACRLGGLDADRQGRPPPEARPAVFSWRCLPSVAQRKGLRFTCEKAFKHHPWVHRIPRAQSGALQNAVCRSRRLSAISGPLSWCRRDTDSPFSSLWSHWGKIPRPVRGTQGKSSRRPPSRRAWLLPGACKTTSSWGLMAATIARRRTATAVMMWPA